MSNLRTAAQQALEALELAQLNGKGGLYRDELRQVADAITALRAALAEPVQDGGCHLCTDGCPACDARKLAEPTVPSDCADSHPPVAWTTGWHGGYCVIRAANPAAILPIGVPLYTAPPQRKPLTEEEIKECERQALVDGALPFEQRMFFARAIERAHGICE